MTTSSCRTCSHNDLQLMNETFHFHDVHFYGFSISPPYSPLNGRSFLDSAQTRWVTTLIIMMVFHVGAHSQNAFMNEHSLLTFTLLHIWLEGRMFLGWTTYMHHDQMISGGACCDSVDNFLIIFSYPLLWSLTGPSHLLYLYYWC